MKYLGIDYGTKKIGIATSDDGGSIAFPYKVIPNNEKFFEILSSIITSEKISEIVIGYSVMGNNTRNDISDDIDAFAEIITQLTGLPIHMQDERFSSSAVSAFNWSKPVATPRRTQKDTTPQDDRAAAIMLQRFLDKKTF
jgi:putative Holliday junction resolvase